MNEELVQLHQEEKASLRDLARYINTQVLAARLEQSDATGLADPTVIHDVMTDEEVSTARRVEMSDALASRDIDWEELTDDFISYQTVRRHLQNCLDHPTDHRGIETVEEGREVLAWAREHHENVVERTLNRLARVRSLELEEIRPSITVRVRCEACDRTHDLETLFEEDGCTCMS